MNIDVEWVYRRLVPDACRRIAPALRALDAAAQKRLRALLRSVERGVRITHEPAGPLGRAWTTRAAVAAVAMLLGAYLAALVL